MRACLGIPGKPCGRITSAGSRCPTCKREFQRQRKARGLTGERGSTHASRQRRQRVLERANHRCFYCTAPATIEDHYIPKAHGGSEDDSNMVAACQPCNSVKSDKMPAEFMESEWLAERCRDMAERRDAA
jgi:5-methylcytosine-specific restriction enzyme A